MTTDLVNMISEKMKIDPTFAEKVLAAKKNHVEASWADVALGNGNEQSPLPPSQHERIDEVRVVAQALAFRQAVIGDILDLTRLVNDAYAPESSGYPQGFRTQTLVDVETIRAMIWDKDCHWILVREISARYQHTKRLVPPIPKLSFQILSLPLLLRSQAEAPNGRGAVPDGTILGCLCYSLQGAEGSLDHAAAIRLLGVSPPFQALYVGRRLLQRFESAMANCGCPRVRFCIPELRSSIAEWSRRQGYETFGVAEFPLEMAATFSRPTRLLVMSKDLAQVAGDSGMPASTSATTKSDIFSVD